MGRIAMIGTQVYIRLARANCIMLISIYGDGDK